MKKLFIEADLDDAVLEVPLRLYQATGDDRRILHVQDLYNIVKQLRGPDGEEWSSADRDFLKRLFPEINKPHLIRDNLNVLRVPRRTFDDWLEIYRSQPDRFIERGGQQAYSKTLPPAGIRFELECCGDSTRVSALVTTPDGSVVPYCRVKRRVIDGRPQVVAGEQLMELDVPIDPEILEQMFGDRDPAVLTAKIAGNLPVLLNNRLDLVSGPSVARVRRVHAPTIQLQCDGADVMVTARIENARITADSPRDVAVSAIPPMRLTARGDGFTIIEYASEALPAVREFLRSLPLISSAGQAYRLRGLPENISQLHVAWKKLPGDVVVEADPGIQEIGGNGSALQPSLRVQAGRGWFEFDLGGTIGEWALGRQEIEEVLRDDGEFVRLRNGRWVRVAVASRSALGRLQAETGLRFGPQRLPATAARRLARTIDTYTNLRVHRTAAETMDAIRALPDVAPIELPKRLAAVMRGYQKDGAEFIHNRSGLSMGCILADDMGLGKTIQVLAYLEAARHAAAGATLVRSGDSGHRERRNVFHALVVCPSSVVSVWSREVERFTPSLHTQELTGSAADRRQALADTDSWDLLIASYATVRNDIEHLRDFAFHTVVLDEAQQIKNPDAAITHCVKGLQAQHRIAVTGTPLENRLLDLWSITDFLNPGYLGSREEFHRHYIVENRDPKLLNERLAPLLLRRLKKDVAPELPPRTDETVLIPLTDRQLAVYRSELDLARQGLRQKGVMQILASLTRLRQISCHLRLVADRSSTEHGLAMTEPGPDDVLANRGDAGDAHAGETSCCVDSAKLERLLGMLREINAAGHSALVFSQFTQLLAIIEEHLSRENMTYFIITGETRPARRPAIVDAFSGCADPAVFLLSLRAAGTGLNLTKADYVFIFDPWWNPAVEQQAIDRTHRIGQDKPVMAYRLVAADTVEERILSLQEEKRALFAAAVDGGGMTPANLTAAELAELLE